MHITRESFAWRLDFFVGLALFSTALTLTYAVLEFTLKNNSTKNIVQRVNGDYIDAGLGSQGRPKKQSVNAPARLEEGHKWGSLAKLVRQQEGNCVVNAQSSRRSRQREAADILLRGNVQLQLCGSPIQIGC